MDQLRTIEQFLTEFMEKLGIQVSNISIMQQDQNLFVVNIDTLDAPLLIGRHGAGIRALQQMVSLVVKRKIDPNLIVRVDVGHYKETYEERLIDLANKKAAKVIAENVRETFFPLNSYHRRIVHLHIAEYFPEIETDSIGEDPNRRILLKKKETIA